MSAGQTRDKEIAASTEFVCERWGQGEAFVELYAPLTRGDDGVTWIHPAWARDYQWKQITARATRIWLVSGSLWNPGTLRLIYCRESGVKVIDAYQRRTGVEMKAAA